MVATDFADELYVLEFFESLRIRHAKAEPTFRFHNGYSFDFPQTGRARSDFLVVAANGDNTSPDSTKVCACMMLKSKGYPCFLLSEELWLAHMDDDRIGNRDADFCIPESLQVGITVTKAVPGPGGNLTFTISRPNREKSAIVPTETRTMTQAEFTRLLRTGLK